MLSNKKEWPILYKYTSKGQVQQWQIVAEGNAFYTIEGIKDGKLTTSLPTVCVGKNPGRKNETTPEEQAAKEAAARFQKKLDKGYSAVLSSDKAYFEPMLAKDFKESKDVDFENCRVFVQPKLDGLRAINEKASLTSRNGKPFVAAPHLHQEDVTLDGELYNHYFKDNFNKIVSLVKKTKPTQDDLEESANLVQMWVYDFPGHEGPFSERYEKLKEWHSTQQEERFVLVPTFEVRSREEIDEYHAKFLSEGFEGTIVRLDLGPYENKRSKQLLKYKDFKDEEFIIVGYEEGVGNRVGTIGYFILQHDKNPAQTFKSNVKGGFDYLRSLWVDRESYVGKTATVKYFARTPRQENGGGDVPRFPFIIQIDREAYE